MRFKFQKNTVSSRYETNFSGELKSVLITGSNELQLILAFSLNVLNFSCAGYLAWIQSLGVYRWMACGDALA